MMYCGRTECKYITKSWYETERGDDAYNYVCPLDHCEYHGADENGRPIYGQSERGDAE